MVCLAGWMQRATECPGGTIMIINLMIIIIIIIISSINVYR